MEKDCLGQQNMNGKIIFKQGLEKSVVKEVN
jgi:hypothetical protein